MRAAKVDANHRIVVAAFKALGCTVQSLAAVGKGVPDLLVGLLGANHLVEVKTETGKQTPAQVKWAALWRTPTHLVRNIADVQRLVRAWRDATALADVEARMVAALLGVMPDLESPTAFAAAPIDSPEVK